MSVVWRQHIQRAIPLVEARGYYGFTNKIAGISGRWCAHRLICRGLSLCHHLIEPHGFECRDGHLQHALIRFARREALKPEVRRDQWFRPSVVYPLCGQPDVLVCECSKEGDENDAAEQARQEGHRTQETEEKDGEDDDS